MPLDAAQEAEQSLQAREVPLLRRRADQDGNVRSVGFREASAFRRAAEDLSQAAQVKGERGGGGRVL